MAKVGVQWIGLRELQRPTPPLLRGRFAANAMRAKEMVLERNEAIASAPFSLYLEGPMPDVRSGDPL